MVHLQKHLTQIRELGADLVTIGSGRFDQAAAFRQDFELDFTVLSDQERQSYQMADLNRGVGRAIGLKAVGYIVGSLARGHTARAPQGDTLQLGGALVISNGGDVLLTHREEFTGDHVTIEDLIRVLSKAQDSE